MLLMVSFVFCSKNMFPVFGDTPDFSESHYNYIIMDYPVAVSVDEVYFQYMLITCKAMVFGKFT